MLSKVNLTEILKALLGFPSKALRCPWELSKAPNTHDAGIILFCDEPIVAQLIQRGFAASPDFESVQTFRGKQIANEALQFLSTCGGLFGGRQSALLIYEDKISQKQAEQEAEQLKRLPQTLPVPVIILLPLSMRSLSSYFAIKSFNQFICWPPSEAELTECTELLIKYFPTLAKDGAERRTLRDHCLNVFNGQLQPIFEQLQRMQDTGMSFQDCLMGFADIGAFDVIDSLCRKNREHFYLRLKQCQENGESAASILSALSYFLKQLLSVLDELEKSPHANNTNWREVFEKTKIPFPAQARLQRAAGVIPSQQIAKFFVIAPHLEILLRTHDNPFGLLAVELSQIFAYNDG